MKNAQAIAVTKEGQVELVSIQVPDLQPGEILIRTEVSTISPGTELRCLAGLQPDSLDYPFVPGYSLVGVVEEVTPGSSVALGDRVFVAGTRRASINLQWGGHVSLAITNASDAVLVPVGCEPRIASFTKLVAIALRGVRISQPKLCDKVAVVGLGPIGMLSARLFRATGAKVIAIDMEPERVHLAAQSGLNASCVEGTIQSTVHTHFGEGADIVVDATGVPAVLPLSMAAAKDAPWGVSNFTGSKLIIQGSYPDRFCLPYQEAFRKELHILMPRDTTPALLRDAVTLIAEGTCVVEDLISWYGDPCASAAAYSLLKTDRSAMTASFDWSRY